MLARWQLNEKGEVAQREVVRGVSRPAGDHGAGPGAWATFPWRWAMPKAG